MGADPAVVEAPADPDAGSSDISDEEVSALLEKGDAAGYGGAGQVRPYELPRISRTQLPMLQVAGKSFAERARPVLSALMGRDANAELLSIDTVKAPDLEAALPVPGSVAVLRLKPLPGLAFVSVEPKLLLALLDGFFGGSGRAAAEPQAAVAPAAQRFLALVLRSLGPVMAAAFAPVTPIEPELVKLEQNPKLLQLGGPHESLTVMRVQVEFGADSGRIDWLLPEALLEPIRETLATDGGKPPVRKQDPWGPALGAGLKEAELEVRAILSQAEVSLGDLVRLAPGDIIPIEPPQEALLLVGDVPVHRGRFGVSQGKNALKIIPGGTA